MYLSEIDWLSDAFLRHSFQIAQQIFIIFTLYKLYIFNLQDVIYWNAAIFVRTALYCLRLFYESPIYYLILFSK
ncbi:hypothetical protein QHL1GM_10845 [Halomonas sp. QHL1]|nr:hypothetical protein QHL1GM_10845 [Halomonas sp. QHL1]